MIVAALLFALGMRALATAGDVRAVRLRRGHDRSGILQGHSGAPVDQRANRRSLRFVHLVARNRRRYGGYIVHAGIVMLFAAFAGMAFKLEYDVTLSTGEAFEAKDPYGHMWRFVSQGVSTSSRADRETSRRRPRGIPRRKARRDHLEREAPLPRLAGESALPADHRSRHPIDREARHVRGARRSSQIATPPSCA